MSKNLPKGLNNTSLVGPDGELKVNPGRYARKAIVATFDMLGGVEAFAEWADENKDEFYTKLFPKIVGKEVEIGVSEGVESLLDKLDNGVLDNAEIIDAEFEEIPPPSSHKPADPRLLAYADEYADGEEDDEEADYY